MLPSQAAALREIDPLVLGERLCARRRALDLDVTTVAGDDCAESRLRLFEAGELRPEETELTALSDRLGVTVDLLLFGAEPHALNELTDAVDKAADALNHGDVDSAETLLRQVMRQLDEPSGGQTRERATFLMARCNEMQGLYDEAITELERLAAATPRGVPPAHVLVALSRCCRESGDLTRAVSAAEAAVARYADEGEADSTESFQAIATAAMAHYVRGDQRHALRMCRRAIHRAERNRSAEGAAALHWNMSMFQCDQGETEKALPSAMKALALLEGSDDTHDRARMRAMIGIMHLRLDPPDLDLAVDLLSRAAADLALSSAGHLDIARTKIALARAHLLDGDTAAARATVDESLVTVRGASPTLEADAEVVLGQLDASEGDSQQAAARYRRAVALLTGVGPHRGAADLWFELGELLRDCDEPLEALAAFRSAAASMGVGARHTLRAGI